MATFYEDACRHIQNPTGVTRHACGCSSPPQAQLRQVRLNEAHLAPVPKSNPEAGECQQMLGTSMQDPNIRSQLRHLQSTGCRPTIVCEDVGEGRGGKTDDDLKPGPDGGTSPRIVMSSRLAGLVSQPQFNQLLAHELVHARYSHAEAHGAERPHVGAEEVEAYWTSGCCDEGGASRRAGQTKCECVQENSTRSCIDAGLKRDECERAVGVAIRRSPCDCG